MNGCFLSYSWELALSGQGLCSMWWAGQAAGATEQKPDLAASVPFWDVGLVPRDEGNEGEVEKTSLSGPDVIKGLEA